MLPLVYQMEVSDMEQWTVKEMATYVGISADTLRYYEKNKIIVPNRLENGYRVYNTEHLLELKFILVMKYARFSLSEIKLMMEWLRSEPSVACNTASKELLALKAAEIKQTIAHYTKIAALLEELPQIDEVQDYSTVQKDVNTFVEHIFTDIRKDGF
ncbi:Mercuric resistance operon regulatory protein [Listeria monocytogenes]|nr:Mercuric resistance operon regulatory protein [Listeria monocytogenes]RJZ32942.1 Mercuric resistance operon regulatory protein [Listeria monocytogenes]RKB77213.1 Mercuric resistance operon regulatory protein [Listeria monocytogenes]CUL12153.1 conserved hypothetical protein [Listeria monocytogenes]